MGILYHLESLTDSDELTWTETVALLRYNKRLLKELKEIMYVQHVPGTQQMLTDFF